jgi:hypothetical protein
MMRIFPPANESLAPAGRLAVEMKALEVSVPVVTSDIAVLALAGRLTDAGSTVAAASWEQGASVLGRLLSAVAGGRLTRSCITLSC